MNTTSDARTWLNKLLATGKHSLSTETGGWVADLRKESQHILAELPLPNRKQEDWRYTSIESLTRHTFEPFTTEFTALQEDDLPEWVTPDGSVRLVLVNGIYQENLSSLPEIASGLTLESLRTALGRNQGFLQHWLKRCQTGEKDVFSSLNRALMNDGLYLHVPENCEIEQPIEICYLTLELDNPVLAQPRNLIVLETGAKISLVERFYSTGQSVYFMNGVTDIILNENAQMNHCRIQEESRQAFHQQHLNITQNGYSRFQHTAVSLGASWARNTVQVSLDAPGAECNLDGLYTVGEKQLADFHLDIRHNAPYCSSHTNFRGVLHGKGRGVFDGAIYVAQDAQKTDAHLSNKNLLLCRDAEIDTKPQLEIYADDVKCSHGTTVGQIEPEQVFYLRSRGIDEVHAKKMISVGFAREAIETIESELAREYADKRLSAVLSETLDYAGEKS